jgi:oligoendopeptidase F
MPKRLTRSEVPVEHTWNLDDVFPTKDAWEAELQAVERDIASVTRYEGHLCDGASMLLECVSAQEALLTRLGRVGFFTSLDLSVDGADPVKQEMAGRAAALGAKVEASLSFVRTEILSLPDGTVEKYLREEIGLDSFRRSLEILLAHKPHMLSPDTEVAVASLSEVLDAPYLIYQRSKSADMVFEPVLDGQGNNVEMSFAMYEVAYEKSPDATLRRNAYASFTKGLQTYRNTFGATWGTEVKKHVVMAKLRRYPSAIHMLLHPQEVPFEVYNNLHDVIQAEIAPHMRKYVALRKKVLGLDKTLYCDIEAPLDPEFRPEIGFQDAAKMIIDALSVLGPEYAEVIRSAFTNRWIDRADNVGKSTGAFCGASYGFHPYILTTWGNELRGAFALAHELGHAGHFVLTERNQRPVNATASMFFVEAPSTINELLLADYILSTTTDVRMRRWVLMGLLATYYHNFVRHMLEAELQRRVYKLAEAGQPITATILSRVKGEILQGFWGGAVEIDEGARLTWMRQPHYYMGLYPYTYSAGLTCGTAVAQDFREQGKPAVERWLEALKAGGTRKPLDLMKMAGVDLSKPDPIRKAVAYVGSIVEEVEKTF